MAKLPSTYDNLFTKHAGGIPVEFLKALTLRESNFNPGEDHYPGYGLMQITPIVVEGTQYRHDDMLAPEPNIKVGAALIRRISTAYAKHPSPNMKPDWGNPEFVKLVLAGWNSGYSEAGGVGKVAKYLEMRDIPVTHDNVFKYAGAAGATRHLQNDAKRRWQAGVSSLYFANRSPLRFVAIAGGVTLAAILIARKL